MQVKTLLAIGLGTLMLTSTTGADDHTPFAAEIKARQSVFQVYKYNMGLLGAMAKGETEYNAQVAVDAAWNLNAASMMKNGTMWPPGSDNSAVEGTRALPEIWSTYPAIVEKGKALTDASTALVAVAGNGLDELRGAMGAVGKSCKGCHDDYRAKKK